MHVHLRPRPAAWYPQPHPGCWVLCPLGMPQHTEVSRWAFGLVRSAACAHAAAPQRRRRPAAWPRHVLCRGLGAAAHTRPLRPCPPDPPLGPRGAPSVRTPRLAGPASALGFAVAWPLLGHWLIRAVYRARSHRSWFSVRVRPAPCPRRGRGGGGNYPAAAAANSSISTTISSYVSV